MTVREMTIEDYEGVYALWMSIKGFAIRSLDDSREGVGRFLRRNPDMSVVALEEGKIVEEGTPEEIFSAPKQPRTRDFLAKVL